MLASFRRILDPAQVYDMMEPNPSTGKPYGATKALETHGHVPNLSVLVCGGDGTVGWVSSRAQQSH